MGDFTHKRLFFGLEIHAPWPENLPSGRLITNTSRHATLAFLGNIDWEPLEALLKEIPKPEFKVGLTGIFDGCLFLPPHHPRVVGWHLKFIQEGVIIDYQRQLIDWLKLKGYRLDECPFLPHVTLARAPFHADQWLRTFVPLPLITTAIHLYESVGNLVYKSIWSYPLTIPFEEIPHTADMAFIVRGESFNQLASHAWIALAFEFPQLAGYWLPMDRCDNLDTVIRQLNGVVSRVDVAVGCPFKAISLHGEALTDSQGVLQWEMIVDV